MYSHFVSDFAFTKENRIIAISLPKFYQDLETLIQVDGAYKLEILTPRRKHLISSSFFQCWVLNSRLHVC
jgi:hypothetical protein